MPFLSQPKNSLLIIGQRQNLKWAKKAPIVPDWCKAKAKILLSWKWSHAACRFSYKNVNMRKPVKAMTYISLWLCTVLLRGPMLQPVEMVSESFPQGVTEESFLVNRVGFFIKVEIGQLMVPCWSHIVFSGIWRDGIIIDDTISPKYALNYVCDSNNKKE